jgi:hypothetical protein
MRIGLQSHSNASDGTRQVVERLIELGVPLTWEQVAVLAGDGVVGRPHIARAMVDAGVISEPAQAFTSEWLAPGGRAYVSRYALDPVAAVRLVRAAGGAPILARPKAGSPAIAWAVTPPRPMSTRGLSPRRRGRHRSAAPVNER